MNPKAKIAIQAALVALFGAVLAFFVALNAVFSDAFGVAAYVGLMFYVLGTYAAVGFLFGAFAPARGATWGMWLAVPALLVLALYTFAEPGGAFWHVVVLVLAVIGGSLGAGIGAGIRRRRHAADRDET